MVIGGAHKLRQTFLQDLAIVSSERKILQKLVEELSRTKKEIANEAKLIKYLDEEIHECYRLLDEILPAFDSVIPQLTSLSKSTNREDARRMLTKYNEKVYPLILELEEKMRALKSHKRDIERGLHKEMAVVSTIISHVNQLEKEHLLLEDLISEELTYLEKVVKGQI